LVKIAGHEQEPTVFSPVELLVMFLIYILDIAAINIEKQHINEIIELVNI